MGEVFLWSAIFLGTMVVGYLFKRAGIFGPENKKFLSDVIFYLTLPALVVSSFAGASVDFWFLVSFGIGLAANFLMLVVGTIVSLRKTPDLQALYTISCPGLNLGNIVIPFLTNFFPAGLPYLCMADTADSFFSLGTTYAIACVRLGKERTSLWKQFCSIVSSLCHSVPMITYAVMTVLSLMHIELPYAVLQAADFIGRSNGFLVMLMVGISLEIKLSRDSLGEVITVLLVRYGCAAAMALGIWFLLPTAPLPMRQILMLACFAPTTSIGLVYCTRLGVRTEVATALSPLSTILMIPMMSAVMFLMG